MKNLITILLMLVLTACGGGGGSSGDAFRITFSDKTLAFEIIEAQTPTAKVVTATAQGSSSQDMYMGATVTGMGITSPIEVLVNSAAQMATIHVKPEANLAPGTYTGTITLLACTTPSCAKHHAGSPHNISYTVKVLPALKASQLEAGLVSPQGSTSSVTQIGLTNPSPTPVNAQVLYEVAPAANWLSAQVNGNTLSLQASPGLLALGLHRATVRLRLADNSQTLDIAVVLRVTNGLLVSPGRAITISNTSTTLQMSGIEAVALAPGVSASSWTARSDQPWLKLDTASGGFGTPMAWHIDAPAFSQLANMSANTATVTIDAGNGLTPTTYVLEVAKAMASIKTLDNAALRAGEAGTLMIYGANFDKLTVPANHVSVMGATPVAVTRVSDRALRLTMPAMQEGNYDVSLTSVSGVTGPKSVLHVSASASFAYQTIATTGSKTVAVYDDLSKSIFVVNLTSNSVMRFAAVNGSFQLITSRSFEMVDSIAMTRDHAALIMQSGGNKVYKLSPTDLSTLRIFDLEPGVSGPAQYIEEPLPIVADNRLLNLHVGWLDLDTGAKTQIANDNFYTMANFAAVSGDGERMLWPDSGRTTPGSITRQYEMSNGTFNAVAEVPLFYNYAVSRDGSRWAMNNRVMGFDGSDLGNYETPPEFLSDSKVMSRSGTRLYVYGQVLGSSLGRVYVFDTSTASTLLLGQIDVPQLANCPYTDISNPACPIFRTRMGLVADERTLFVVGNTHLVIVPIPLNLRAPVGSPAPAKMQKMVRLPARR